MRIFDRYVSHGGFVMGIIAESIMAYAQPLLEDTDGSIEEMQKGMALAQVCWNLAIMPDEERPAAIESLRESLSLSDAEIEEMRETLFSPMISRHKEMFPLMHQPKSRNSSDWISRLSSIPSANSDDRQPPKPGRYDPCPCNSGKKYKFCCERKSRPR
ncbi:MAG: SEC-C domain-containing protein [Planctomycetales bacterium]|nr:SEC-C domain-containing protein [Planctomycetales bacterium]